MHFVSSGFLCVVVWRVLIAAVLLVIGWRLMRAVEKIADAIQEFVKNKK